MRHRRIVLALFACHAFFASPGCEVTSSFWRDDSNSVSSFYDRMTSTSCQHEWWQSYGEYFLSKGGVGRMRSGGRQEFEIDHAILREGRRGDLLRALRSDLLEMAADSGVTVHRPLRQLPAGGKAEGFEFDYSEGRIKGKVCVEIKPSEKAGEVDVTCVIDESDHCGLPQINS